jgi:hypothetical protein
MGKRVASAIGADLDESCTSDEVSVASGRRTSGRVRRKPDTLISEQTKGQRQPKAHKKARRGDESFQSSWKYLDIERMLLSFLCADF